MNQNEYNPEDFVISYMILRRAVGLAGVLLPFVLLFGTLVIFRTDDIEKSISYYYYTDMGDVFVGIIFVIGAFLFSYKGYTKLDNYAGDLACVFAIGVALCPTTPDVDASLADKIIGGAHLFFAVSLFLTLSYFSLCLFTRTNKGIEPTDRKKMRNIIYRACGYTILIMIALIALQLLLPEGMALFDERNKPVFWLETVIVVVFGISWLTKGEALFWDRDK